MSNKNKRAKWLYISLTTLAVLVFGSFLFINNELKKMYGGYTERVVSSDFISNEESLIIIKNVNVLSNDGQSFLPNKTVVIADGQIYSVTDDVSKRSEGTVIDGTDKYLIPGLIDAHVHLWQSPNDFLLFLANGVTTIYEVKGFDFQLDWKNEIDSGIRLGPNLLVASTKLQTDGFFRGAFMHWMQGDINVSDPEKAYQIVKEIKDKGYEAIKVGSFLSEESYNAIDAVAKELEMPLIGHFPYKMKLEKLYQSSQSNVMHLEEFVKNLNYQFGRIDAHNCDEFLNYVDSKGPQIARELKKSNISVTTTLRLMERILSAKISVKETLKDVEVEYANPGLMEGTVMTSRALGWLPDVNTYRRSTDLTEDQKRNSDAFWNTYVKANKMFLKYFLDADVKILAGTDTNVSPMVAGFSIHNELECLNRSGMSPSQALRAATINSASYLNLNKGKVAVGFDADLILLNKNPLFDIRNTRFIEKVILRGKVYSRSELDQMLETVKRANNESRKISIEEYL
ncbi:amidohydrolase family protein [Ekhidna sp.]